MKMYDTKIYLHSAVLFFEFFFLRVNRDEQRLCEDLHEIVLKLTVQRDVDGRARFG